MADVKVSTRVQWRDELGRYAAQVEEGAEEAQVEASELGARLAAAFAPKRRTVLAGSIHSNGHGFETGALPHALPQEEGAGPHLIGEPGQTLSGDGFGPVKGPVLHPGNPAVHYMRKAGKIVGARLMGIVRSKMP